jgi:polyisoprenoid-binding protein YceI
MKKIILLIAVILIPQIFWAQTKYLAVTSSSEIVVLGTSTLHDWDMKGNIQNSSFEGSVVGNEVKSIQKVDFTMSSTALKSKEGTQMDKKAYEALKSDKNSLIKFSGSNVNFSNKLGRFSGTVSGNLSLAGVTKTVTVPFTGSFDGSYINITGEYKIKMSDYNMTPPVALMGTIKCGDVVTVKFTIKYKN